jgi:hypothetical protein
MDSLIWKNQLYILISFAIALIGFSLLVWLHPKLGYAPSDSIIAGADLRIELIQIVWIWFGILSISSSIILKIATRFSKRWPIWIIAYGIGLVTIILALPLIDRYY